ncbi:L-idonate 5-dehydrogenase [Algicella marina]|uniref:Alcohol dehydrogenase catalytic domain-containing protein n=1 Tax=Algicella marina TaxID=2683284 RepID=A0A6P1T5L0_9RHOB|nr:L-idonate 5-dehydrogenase [Algicella marina]QHQ37337.1 alcohol dehydrogenase catalytic domain-containing protein [Algicella marina]
MKSLVLHAAEDLRIEEHSAVEPGAAEVQIRLAAGGICGSDLHYFNHGGFGSVRLREPMILGHEVAGYVSAIGTGVAGLEIGQLVAVSPSRPCENCRECLANLPNHCRNMRFYGSAMPFPHVQGAFRELLTVDASQCVAADGLTPSEAATAEPLSVCLHGISRAGSLLGKSVLITGSGPIGVLTCLAALAMGASEVTVTDISDTALRHAVKAGADRAINVAGSADDFERLTLGNGSFDIMFECSGAASALQSAIPAMRPRGVIVQLGLGPDAPLPLTRIAAKELDLRGSFRFHEEFATAVRLMQKRAIDVRPLVTHSFPLSDAVAAFQTASDKSKSMKTQILF